MLFESEGYWCYWHGARRILRRRPPRAQGALLRAALLRPSGVRPRDADRRAPTSRGVTVASVYVPNGGKDYAAKLRFLEALEGYAGERRAAGPRAAAVRGHERRAHRPRRAPQGAEARRDRSASEDERALSRRSSPTASWTSAARSIRTTTNLFTWWAPWRNLRQRNIGWRIDYILASEPLAAARHGVRGAGGGRHERPRARRGGFRRVLSCRRGRRLSVVSAIARGPKREDIPCETSGVLLLWPVERCSRDERRADPAPDARLDPGRKRSAASGSHRGRQDVDDRGADEALRRARA